MNKPIIIIGAGGHAKVVLNVLKCRNFNVLGFVDPNKLGSSILGSPVLGCDEVIFQYRSDEVLLTNGIGSTSDTTLRRQIFVRFSEQGYCFPPVVHPSVIVAPDVCIGQGVQIMAGAIVQPGVIIGQNSILNTRVSIDHDCIIGDHVHVAPGAVLSGNVKVRDGTHIGSGSVIVQGINIGRNCVIGAGAVVINDVPDGATVIGVPGRVVKNGRVD